ncbi:hypothetical protein [Bifidobacterium pseudolongum]
MIMLIAISALRNVVIAICDYDSIVILRWRVGTPIAYITECKADHFGIQWNLEGVRHFRFGPWLQFGITSRVALNIVQIINWRVLLIIRIQGKNFIRISAGDI